MSTLKWVLPSLQVMPPPPSCCITGGHLASRISLTLSNTMPCWCCELACAPCFFYVLHHTVFAWRTSCGSLTLCMIFLDVLRRLAILFVISWHVWNLTVNAGMKLPHLIFCRLKNKYLCCLWPPWTRVLTVVILLVWLQKSYFSKSLYPPQTQYIIFTWHLFYLLCMLLLKHPYRYK